jgi:hypothetical protein
MLGTQDGGAAERIRVVVVEDEPRRCAGRQRRLQVMRNDVFAEQVQRHRVGVAPSVAPHQQPGERPR